MHSLANSIALLLSASLAAGCCCPELSGRYCRGPQPLPTPAAQNCGCMPAAGGHSGLAPCGHGLEHGPLFAWLHGGLVRAGAGGPVPSQQHDDYQSPLAKFHPVPTRPVFEPLAEQPAVVLLDQSPQSGEGRLSRWK
jgi:hypothetical protein